MASFWTGPQDKWAWDGYLDWAHRGGVAEGALEPAFVRLRPDPAPQSGFATARAALRALMQGPKPTLWMDEGERARFDALGDQADAQEVLIYRPVARDAASHAAHDAIFEVLDLGMPTALSGEPEAPAAPLPQGAAHPGPVVAVIDDAIGFLNSRFCRQDAGGEMRTRFGAVWLQSAGLCPTTTPGLARSGRVLRAAEIDSWLARGRVLDEAAVYDGLMAQIAGPDMPRRVGGFSHGTHVLDLAAGADPAQAQAAPPLLAVQLPPEAVADTSGARFDTFLVQAVRWILDSADRLFPGAPVVINISLGMLAGPKDGSLFAEHQIAREALLREARGAAVRVVYSFGNSHKGRQVASLALPAGGGTHEVTWRVQPGDLTPNFIEIHTGPGCHEAGLQMCIEPPGGPSSGFFSLVEGQSRDMVDDTGAPIARVWHLAPHPLAEAATGRPRCMIAVAPTVPRGPGDRTAPAGGWQLALRSTGEAPVTLRLQIQRDDTAPGYRPLARQSYFDDPAAHAWQDDAQDYRGLAPESALSRAGAHSALVTARAAAGADDLAPQVYSVGAAQRRDAARIAPSGYSGEGAGWSVPGPDLSALADEGVTLTGVLAAGRFSGSVRALSGTSAAAARATRALWETGFGCADSGSKAREIAAMAARGQVPDPSDASRLGALVLTEGGGPRPRG